MGLKERLSKRLRECLLSKFFDHKSFAQFEDFSYKRAERAERHKKYIDLYRDFELSLFTTIWGVFFSIAVEQSVNSAGVWLIPFAFVMAVWSIFGAMVVCITSDIEDIPRERSLILLIMYLVACFLFLICQGILWRVYGIYPPSLEGQMESLYLVWMVFPFLATVWIPIRIFILFVS